MDRPELCFEQFYQVLARYLLDEDLVNKIEINSKYLRVCESCSGRNFDFVLTITKKK